MTLNKLLYRKPFITHVALERFDVRLGMSHQFSLQEEQSLADFASKIFVSLSVVSFHVTFNASRRNHFLASLAFDLCFVNFFVLCERFLEIENFVALVAGMTFQTFLTNYEMNLREVDRKIAIRMIAAPANMALESL